MLGRETKSPAYPALPGKTRFEEIYDQPDPRLYFQTLGLLEYQIPHHGQRAFQALAEARRRTSAGAGLGTVVDLCCSYGINTALLNHDLSLQDLHARYTSAELADLPTAELMALDRLFFQQRRLRSGAARSVGIDAAEHAVAYAIGAGVLDRAFSENLEVAQPSPALRAAIADARLVTVTGGVGYIYTRTFERLLGCFSTPPWIAAFVLRTVPYQPIADVLARFGLVTEKFPGRTFPQRRFSDARERKYVLSTLSRQGLDPAEKEAEGYYHTDLYVSRPPRDIAELPLPSLLAPLTGQPTSARNGH